MPGIVGLITKMPAERAVRELAQMVRAMHHQPTYLTGTHVDETNGVYVGWWRVKVHPVRICLY